MIIASSVAKVEEFIIEHTMGKGDKEGEEGAEDGEKKDKDGNGKDA